MQDEGNNKQCFNGSKDPPGGLPSHRKILVIVPAYNEQGSVGNVINKIRRCLPHVDVLVVNDGSSDSTSAIAERAGAMVLDLPYNMGIGAAMQAGYKFAHRRDYDIAVQCDGDGQHHPSQIKTLVEALMNSDADVVLGSRYLSSRRFKSTVPRRLGMLVFSNVLSLIVGQRLTDTTSGFRAVNKEVIESFSVYYPDDYPEPEALVILHKEGFSIKEMPVSMSSRRNGSSSITPWKSTYYAFKVLLAIFVDLFKEIPYKKQATRETRGNAENTDDNRGGKHSTAGDRY